MNSGQSRKARLLRVAIVSHAYSEPELRKDIVALTEYSDPVVVCPQRADVLVFRNYQFAASAEAADLFRPIATWPLFGSQYVFRSLDLGFRGDPPAVVNIEYEPWSVMFWQVLAARLLYARDARVVCSVKKNTYRRYRGVVGMLKRHIARSGIRHVDRFLAASMRTRQLYESTFDVAPDRMDIVTHLGVDVRTFRPHRRLPSRNGVVVGYAGRLSAAKGVRDLVDAVAVARQRSHVNIELSLVGSGECDAALRTRNCEQHWFRLLGLISTAEVAHWLREVDIFVLPARVLADHEEHDAHALLQALSAGVASIGTRSGIIPELLSEDAGVVVEPEDVFALAAAIAELADDPARRRELGARGRQKAQREFSNEVVAARKAAIFRRVCGDQLAE